jgi:hypothetical protein
MPATPQARRRHPWGRARLWSSRAQRRHPDDPRLLRPAGFCAGVEPRVRLRKGPVLCPWRRPEQGASDPRRPGRPVLEPERLSLGEAHRIHPWRARTRLHGATARRNGAITRLRGLRRTPLFRTGSIPVAALRRCLRVDLPTRALARRRTERGFVNSAPRGVAQSGSAFGWGPKGRWFKSSRPDLTKPPQNRGGFVLGQGSQTRDGVHLVRKMPGVGTEDADQDKPWRPELLVAVRGSRVRSLSLTLRRRRRTLSA